MDAASRRRHSTPVMQPQLIILPRSLDPLVLGVSWLKVETQMNVDSMADKSRCVSSAQEKKRVWVARLITKTCCTPNMLCLA